eukprot:6858692-Pyramimonas_sp.AAC.1
MNGKLDAEGFEYGAKLFSEVWRTCNVGEGLHWNWRAAQIRVGEGHMAKGFLVLERFPVRSMVGSETRQREAREEAALELPECMHHSEEELCSSTTTSSRENGASGTDEETHLYDYHIAYSPSYQVPMLFFRGYLSDGRELDWDQLVDDLPESQRHLAKSTTEKWTFLSREEHPHLRRPYYALHPCQTAALLAVMQSTNAPSVDTRAGRGEQLCASQATLTHDVCLDSCESLNSCQGGAPTCQDEGAGPDVKQRCFRYMLAWFSIVGAGVGLALPPGVVHITLPDLCND